MLTAVPASGPWTYGGYPLGLEPLTLPEPGDWLLSGRKEGNPAPPVMLPARQVLDDVEVDTDRLAWFRWITGHQASFVLWRMLGAEVEDLVGDSLLDRCEIDALPFKTWQQYVDGYSAMLLYSGSCTQATYHGLIRPSMRLQHPSFSGSWAPDYICVRKLFHDPRHPLRREPGAWRLNGAFETIHRVHVRVAERLVPGGASLLRASPVKRQDWGDTAFLYDNYFLTRRDPVDRDGVVAQLVSRLGAIHDDLTAHGLYEEADNDAAADPRVRRLEVHMGEFVRELVHSVAASQSADRGRRPITVTR